MQAGVTSDDEGVVCMLHIQPRLSDDDNVSSVGISVDYDLLKGSGFS